MRSPSAIASISADLCILFWALYVLGFGCSDTWIQSVSVELSHGRVVGGCVRGDEPYGPNGGVQG